MNNKNGCCCCNNGCNQNQCCNSNPDTPVIPLPPIVGEPDLPNIAVPYESAMRRRQPEPDSANLPAYPGPDADVPSIPLPPMVGNNTQPPAYPGPDADIPMIPLPPIVGNPGMPNPGIPVIPLPPIVGNPAPPNVPSSRYCKVRFLHAASNEGAFNISIGSQQVASNLSFGNFSEYRFVPDGFWTVTIMTARAPRAILLQKSIPFHSGDAITLAIIQTANGIELNQISDRACNNRAQGMSCLRMANLVYNGYPLDLLLNDGRVVFSNVAFKENTAFNRIRPGNYGFFIAQTPMRPMPRIMDIEIMEEMPIMVSERFMPGYGEVVPLVSLLLRVRANTMYTIYVLGSSSDLQVVVAEN